MGDILIWITAIFFIISLFFNSNLERYGEIMSRYDSARFVEQENQNAQ